MFNFVTLKWAAAVQHPLLQAFVLADQREEAARGEERVQGHLNAMALRLGELQAQVMRLDGLGERLAKSAGLKPQELPSLQSGAAPGRGGAVSSLPSRNLSVQEFSDLVDKLGAAGRRAFRPDVGPGGASCRRTRPIASSCPRNTRSSTAGIRRTSATGSIRSPGSSPMHEGIDFPAESGHAHRGGGERQGRCSRSGTPSMVKW